MFDSTVVKVKAGYVGQIIRGDKIVWESEPFPPEMGLVEDNLRRSTREEDISYKNAYDATQAKIDEVVERLFA